MRAVTGSKFELFKNDIDKRLRHPVITANEYTAWFSTGSAATVHVKDLIRQFAVFSNFFLESQVKRVVRSRTLASRNEALKILVNEFGVRYDKDGNVEGQPFSESQIHFMWLRGIGKQLNLDMGKFGIWESGTPYTQKFIIDLDKVYGSFDPWISEGASFGIEEWAGSYIGDKTLEYKNFWAQLIKGLDVYNKKLTEPLDLGFFTFHFMLESKHVGSVEEELEANFFDQKFDQKKFLEGMERSLDAIYVFWQGLNEIRKTLKQEAIC